MTKERERRLKTNRETKEKIGGRNIVRHRNNETPVKDRTHNEKNTRTKINRIIMQ